MGKVHSYGLALLIVVSPLAYGSFVYGQDIPSATSVFHPNQDVRVNLPSPMARSHDSSDVLLTSLDLIFRDKGICCGKDSAVEDSALAANPLSLKEIASRLQGRHLLSDGRPIAVTADFMSASSNDIGYRIVAALIGKHALLTVWNSHLYVLYGAIYDETLYSDGTRMNVIHKLLLIDPRFSDAHREVVFNRDTDDWTKVEGMLQVTAAPQ
jgi:hypothetical protein